MVKILIYWIEKLKPNRLSLILVEAYTVILCVHNYLHISYTLVTWKRAHTQQNMHGALFISGDVRLCVHILVKDVEKDE